MSLLEAGAAAFLWNLLMNPSKSGPAHSLSAERLTQKGQKQELQKRPSAFSSVTSPHWGPGSWDTSPSLAGRGRGRGAQI